MLKYVGKNKKEALHQSPELHLKHLVQRLFICAGALLRQGLPLAVHHPNRDGGFGLRYTAFGFALEGRDVIPVVQFELQPLVVGFTIILGVFLQFQGTGYPDQAAFSHFAFDQVLCKMSPGPHLEILCAGCLAVSQVFRQGKSDVGFLPGTLAQLQVSGHPTDAHELCHRPLLPAIKAKINI